MNRHYATRLALLSGLFLLAAGPAMADPYCCACKDGAKHLLDESHSTMASGKCSLKCMRPTKATKGVCEAPAPSAAEPAAGPAPSQASTGAVSLYKSEDCSGEAMRLEKSTAQLAAGFMSYQVDSGVVSAFAKTDFGGAATQPILGSMCVSPGWNIGSVSIGK